MTERKPTPVISCLAKQRFASRSLCAGALRQAHRKRGNVDAYRCPHCRGWHIGTSTPKDNPEQMTLNREEKMRKRSERVKYVDSDDQAC